MALITTKVDLPKDDQLLSRFLVMEVRESPDKRKAVLNALAASFNGVQSSPTDDALEPVRAFAEWLGRFKVRVTIPYAYVLADLFAELPASERDFRDFATLLKLIAACALWNLAKRHHSFDGDNLQVTASLDDYATVYRLLLPVWGKPRSAALSETERRVAEALKESDHPATAEELAKVVGITDRSVRRALKDLAEKGLVERGEKRGRSYEWRLIGDLDALTVTLPTPEEVAAAWQPDPDPTRSDSLSPEADHNEPTEPPSDLPKVTICHLSPAVTDIADIHGHDAMSAKNPINTSTFGFTDKRTQDTLQMDDTSMESDRQELNIRNSTACSAFADADSLKNRVRDVRDAKNLSSTSTFCGHSPMSANVRDVRDDRHDRDFPDPEGGLEVKVTCPRCGSWRRVPPDALMLADPLCDICSSVMKPEPEDSEERSIVTGDWVASFFEASNEPVVFDLETNEAIPVASPDCPTKEARCPRCGHREVVDPEVLLPPLCPACSSPMEWISAPDPPNDPLIEAVSRIADLSSQLKTGGGQQ